MIKIKFYVPREDNHEYVETLIPQHGGTLEEDIRLFNAIVKRIERRRTRKNVRRLLKQVV